MFINNEAEAKIVIEIAEDMDTEKVALATEDFVGKYVNNLPVFQDDRQVEFERECVVHITEYRADQALDDLPY